MRKSLREKGESVGRKRGESVESWRQRAGVIVASSLVASSARRYTGEMVAASRMLGALPRNTVLRFPVGTWGYVGSVDARLLYCQVDGSPATDEQLKSARIAGPGFVQGIVRCAWPTREDAIAAADALGLLVSNREERS